jgi:lipopolysaccharide biosynthesis glycosyltransferase
LGIEDHRTFFNAGVLVLDLERFRAENSRSRLLALAATRAEELAMADQDALNLVFAGRWRALHPRWNAQNTLWNSPEVANELFGETLAAEARQSPAILHFEGPSLCKPWHALNSHLWRDTWWATLARTPWAGTRAEDQGPATAVLRVLPNSLRVLGYRGLLGWRNRRSVAR